MFTIEAIDEKGRKIISCGKNKGRLAVYYPQTIPHYAYKRGITTFNREITFKCTEEEFMSKPIDIGSGVTSDEQTVYEQIYTDGNIELKKLNGYKPSFIINEEYFKAHKGVSFEIQLTGATFFVVKTTKGSNKFYEIHHINMSDNSLRAITNAVLERRLNRYNYINVQMGNKDTYTIIKQDSESKEVFLLNKDGMKQIKKLVR